MSLYSLQIKFQITWFYQADPCDGTSDYSSRETSSEETIGGLCQVEFRGIHHVFSRVSFTLVTFLERIIHSEVPASSSRWC